MPILKNINCYAAILPDTLLHFDDTAWHCILILNRQNQFQQSTTCIQRHVGQKDVWQWRVWNPKRKQTKRETKHTDKAIFYLCVYVQEHHMVSSWHHKVHPGIVCMYYFVLGSVEDWVVDGQHGRDGQYLLWALISGMQRRNSFKYDSKNKHNKTITMPISHKLNIFSLCTPYILFKGF